MAIELTKDTVAVWYFEMGEGHNFLAGLNRAPDGTFKLDYRFRYDRGGAPFDGTDKFSWWSGTIGSTDIDEVLPKMRAWVAECCKRLHCKPTYDEILMTEAGLDDFLNRLTAMPWAHARLESTDGRTVDFRKPNT
jgi:hypothetical protein